MPGRFRRSPPRRARAGALPLATALAAACLVTAGCATRWTPRESAAAAPLVWPPAPLAAKLTFLRALTGFAPGPGRAAAWRRFVYGRESAAADALVLPSAVAVAADGTIAVADVGRAAVHLFRPAAREYARITGGGGRRFASPVGLAFDDAGGLYVADSAGALHAFDRDGAWRFARTSAGGERLARPTGLAWSPTRRALYLVDTAASRIHVFATDGAWRFSFGSRGADAGELAFPTHLVRSATGRLFVVDSLNFRVAVFDEDGAPLGAFGRHGDGSGDFGLPKGIAVDAAGVLYVADSVFDNVQLFSERGDYLLTLGRRGNGPGEFWLPGGLFAGADGRLYVCDTYNHRVQVFAIAEAYAPAS